jgi:hypothetical protein
MARLVERTSLTQILRLLKADPEIRFSLDHRDDRVELSIFMIDANALDRHFIELGESLLRQHIGGWAECVVSLSKLPRSPSLLVN